MALALGWKESRIGVGAVFDQQDRGVRPAFTDTSNQRCGALGDLRCDHVGQAIEELSFVRKESWNLRVKLEETVTLIEGWPGEASNEQINEEVEA